MINIGRGIKKWAGYALTAVVLGLFLFSAAEYAIGVQPLYVVSDRISSMSPTINYGDAVLTYRVPFNSISSGDIIAFRNPNDPSITIIHRVVAVKDAGGVIYFETKGDNNKTNPTIDPWNITSKYYLSEVVLIIPYAGYLSPALWGFSGAEAFLPIFFILLLAALFSLMSRRKESKQIELN